MTLSIYNWHSSFLLSFHSSQWISLIKDTKRSVQKKILKTAQEEFKSVQNTVSIGA